jgi:hypothetical protein
MPPLSASTSTTFVDCVEQSTPATRGDTDA